MKINNSVQFKNKLVIKLIILLCLSLLLPLNAFAHDHGKSNSNLDENEKIHQLIFDVLKNTEESLATVEKDTWNSLQHVENAINSIHMLKKELSPDTHKKAKSPEIIVDNKEYWFIYPVVSEDILKDRSNLPTLHSKKKSGILYKGNMPKSNNSYLDYAFAYASLKMAREALTIEDYDDARTSLLWVFDAIYMQPGFNVAKQS